MHQEPHRCFNEKRVEGSISLPSRADSAAAEQDILWGQRTWEVFCQLGAVLGPDVRPDVGHAAQGGGKHGQAGGPLPLHALRARPVPSRPWGDSGQTSSCDVISKGKTPRFSLSQSSICFGLVGSFSRS